jgi:hypothetical protein
MRGEGGKPLGAAGWAARAAANRASADAVAAGKLPKLGGAIPSIVRALSQALQLADAAAKTLSPDTPGEDALIDEGEGAVTRVARRNASEAAADALDMLEADVSAIRELGMMFLVPEAVAQVSAACVVLSAGRGAPKMTDDLSWEVTRTHLVRKTRLFAPFYTRK